MLHPQKVCEKGWQTFDTQSLSAGNAQGEKVMVPKFKRDSSLPRPTVPTAGTRGSASEGLLHSYPRHSSCIPAFGILPNTGHTAENNSKQTEIAGPS